MALLRLSWAACGLLIVLPCIYGQAQTSGSRPTGALSTGAEDASPSPSAAQSVAGGIRAAVAPAESLMASAEATLAKEAKAIAGDLAAAKDRISSGAQSLAGNLLATAGVTAAGAMAPAADTMAPTGMLSADTLAPSGSAVAAGPLGVAPGPRPVANNQSSNIAFALTAAEATFGPNDTLILNNVSPAVTYFSTVPVYHAGNMNTTRFVSGNLSLNGTWLGGPDAALIGYRNGEKAIVLLSIEAALLTGRIARFKAYLLTPDDKPLLQNGPVGAFFRDYALSRGNNQAFLTSVSGATKLVDVSLVVESAMVSVPQGGLKTQGVATATNDGFTYDCFANTAWKPIWCGSPLGGGYYGGFGGYYFGR